MRSSDWSSDVCSSDLSMFYYDYKNKQEQGFTGSQVFLQNTGPVKLYGLDFDTSYRVYHDLPARAALTWVPQAKYRNFDDALAYRPNGRATCREGGCKYVLMSVVAGYFKKKRQN